MAPADDLSGAGPRLDAALRAIAVEGRDWARLWTRTALRASLQRMADEAVVALPAILREQVERAAATTADAGVPISDWVSLLLECARVVEEDVAGRTARLREVIARSGALLAPGVLAKTLETLDGDPVSVHDVGSLLDLWRALSLAEADVARVEWDITRKWEATRAEVAAKLGGPVAEAVDGALRGGDLLPLAEALDGLASLQDKGVALQDGLRELRLGLEDALKSSKELLSPDEVDWVRTALADCPAKGIDARSPAGVAWSAALNDIQRLVRNLVAARTGALSRLEQRFGQEVFGLAATGYRRLLLLTEAARQRQALSEGRIEAARRECLEAEWDLCRAIWEDGPLASASALLDARQAFLDCHRGKEPIDETAALKIARQTSLAAARIRLEASWRRRWLLRQGKDGPDDRQREAQRLPGTVGADVRTAPGPDLEARCREAEAALRAALARHCAALESSTGTGKVRAERARGALLAGDPLSLDRALREARG